MAQMKFSAKSAKYEAVSSFATFASFARDIYLLPGLTAGIFARSGGNLSGSKVSTCSEIKLWNGTPKFTVPFERSTIGDNADHGSAVRADNVNCFLHATALGHDVLDDENFFAGRDFESAPQDQLAVLLFRER